jgi:multidrug efflux pump subunit AcrA (membrane-fusion protein)
VKRLLFVLAALAVGALAWGLSGRDRGADGPTYTLAEVEHGRLAEMVNATGTVQPREVFLVGVGPEVTGQVVEVRGDFNQAVAEGDLLLRLDDRLARRRWEQAKLAVDLAGVAVRQAEAARDNADTSLRSIKQLSSASRREVEVDLAEGQLKAARVAVEAAEVRLSEEKKALEQAELALLLTEVRVPTLAADGPSVGPGARRSGLGALVAGGPLGKERRAFVVLDRKVSLGQQVGPEQGRHLFTLAGDPERVRVHAQVVEGDVNKVICGQAVELTVAGQGDDEPLFRGKVEEKRLLPTTNHGAVFYEVILEVTNRRQAASGEWYLRPGQTATVDIVRRAREAAWKVPLTALSYQPDEAELTAAAKERLARWQQRADRDAWRPVWVLDAERRPSPVLVRVAHNGEAAIQDSQFSEVLEWGADLTPAPDPASPATWPKVITSATPPKNRGLFSTPKIKF